MKKQPSNNIKFKWYVVLLAFLLALLLIAGAAYYCNREFGTWNK